MSLKIAIEWLDPQSAVVIFDGPMTTGMSFNLADSQLRGLIERGVIRLVFDLTNVPYADSSGLGLIVHMYGLTRQKNGQLRLCGLSDRVSSMLKLTATDGFLLTDPDRATALVALNAGSAGTAA